VTGRYLLCGHSLLDCTRPHHKLLRAQDDRRGQEGFYHTTPNASNKVFEAIEDTLVTLEDKTAEQNRNHALLTAIGSQQKALDEAALKDRSPPVLGFDLTAQTPTPRSDLMRSWYDAAPAPVDTQLTNSSVTGIHAVGGSDTTSTVSTDQSHELKTIIRGLVANLSKELGDLRDSVQAQEHALD
jgi:type II secretory pathway pseudopilin PulG